MAEGSREHVSRRQEPPSRDPQQSCLGRSGNHPGSESRIDTPLMLMA